MHSLLVSRHEKYRPLPNPNPFAGPCSPPTYLAVMNVLCKSFCSLPCCLPPRAQYCKSPRNEKYNEYYICRNLLPAWRLLAEPHLAPSSSSRPASSHQDKAGNWVVEWDYESLLSLHSTDIDMRVTRVGFLRYADGVKPEEEEEVAKALLPFSCVPVFLDKTLATRFYRDFCKVGGVVTTSL